MDLWFHRPLLSLSTVPRRVSRAALESSPTFLSYSMALPHVVHHGLCKSPVAGHLDSFQGFAIEKVRMHASPGAVFSWLMEKDCCWVVFVLFPSIHQHCSSPSEFFPLLLTHSFASCLHPLPQPSVYLVPSILPLPISSHNCNPSVHLITDLGPNSLS